MIPAALISALVYEIFVFPNVFAPAGINGITTIIQYLFNFSVGYMSLLVNIPLLTVAFLFLNKPYAVKSLIFVLTFSVSVLVLDRIDLSALEYHTVNGTSTVLAPVAAGAINGIIYACVIRMGGSTGGTDIIAAYIKKKKPHMNFVWIIFSLNIFVAIISYPVYHYKLEPVICCIIYCFVTSNISDTVLRGEKQALKFEVVTSHADELSAQLMRELHHGVTVVNATGMFTNSNKKLIICVINKQQIVEFQQIIGQYSDTFAVVSSVSQTVGNFKKINGRKLQ